MGPEHYSRLKEAVASCLNALDAPVSLVELADRVEATLGGARAPESLLAFVLRRHADEFVQGADGRWRPRSAAGASPRAAAGVAEDLAGFSTLGAPSAVTTNGAARPDAVPLTPPQARPLTPNQAFDHVYESAVEYLEAAYKISHPAVYRERGRILRTRGAVAQAPFVEATPAFPTAHKLEELERSHPDVIPPGLAELVQHGVPVDRFPLYTHQEEALLAAFGEQPNLLVATGTGSGKTEAFLLPILADLLREAATWRPTSGREVAGRFLAAAQEWLHCREHENRPAAVRAIVLYPMNALVNDQLQRLRRILARGASPDWQRQHLGGNLLRFGMYTGLSRPAGSPTNRAKRQRWSEYFANMAAEWEDLREDLRDTGGWPRPNGPEMLCRWDMQLAPPDILVTNYSMLEYMLVRPIEAPIFDLTRRWLEEHEDARLTLVLDEAHTYTGAKGTEVAHLIRRLKERLGLVAGSPQFRAIATSASIPNAPGADDQLQRFTSDLFGEAASRFSLIRVKPGEPLTPRRPDAPRFYAFGRFYDRFDGQRPWPAIDGLAADLNLGPVDHVAEPQAALYRLLARDEDVTWVRARTARNATMLDQLAKECWPGQADAEQRERATGGVLTAGSFARADARADTPPLLSTRIHGFFRGIPGLWACMDPACTAVAQDRDETRPIGKLYTDPRPWCSCGARVLELFSCRHCGLLFLGGIPDGTSGSLWPWSSDLSEERQDYRDFRIFGVEAPHPNARAEHRSTRTTLPAPSREVHTRPTYEVEPARREGTQISPFPDKCPRCQHYRVPKDFGEGREVIEPLGTRGSRTFSVIVEDGFRVQGRVPKSQPPNYGRKALLFSDSRRDAARLAAELREDHADDLFRQLLYRVLHGCPACEGEGTIEQRGAYVIGRAQTTEMIGCPACEGTGRQADPAPLPFTELRRRVIALELALRLNPDNDGLSDFFAGVEAGDPTWSERAEAKFHVALRRELCQEQFALEPLGLARWRVRLPAEVGCFPPLTEPETVALLQAVARLLATEKVLLPPRPHKPWEWPAAVEPEDRCLLISGFKRDGRYIPYNLSEHRKLGRYIIALSHALVRAGRLPAGQAERWVRALQQPLWEALYGFKIIEPAGRRTADGKVPFGIRLDAFELHPIGPTVQRCQACAYVMSEAPFGVCPRCGQQAQPLATEAVRNFYRRAALYALPKTPFEDPYPLRAIEHTAQIATEEARNLERWFQDFFRDNENRDDKRVDVLSVTTTMEMGIDIGSLLCVGMRNIPPTVANYQQRAGRAGRRGSAVATVLTFAQQRSHDQYYFHRPPEIVSEPPRVPALYLGNAVIARRHVRALLLQEYFARRGRITSNLFAAWGTVEQFAADGGAEALRRFLAEGAGVLLRRCERIAHPDSAGGLADWLEALPEEVELALAARGAQTEVLEALILAGLLPRYAFPVDVVSLAIPAAGDGPAEGMGYSTDAMERDRKIALAEYAPGAEVIRGVFPSTYVYTSAGVYDPFAAEPDYRPQGKLVECADCQSVYLAPAVEVVEACRECGSRNLAPPLPYLRPEGFTVDWALPEGGRRLYQRGDGERRGYVAPAQLLAGESSFAVGTRTTFAPQLFTHVHVGELFACNKGPDRQFPGFLICPACGRALDPSDPTSHLRPSNVPPHWGRRRGPRAGLRCPNQRDFSNQVILGHPFRSEVVLLGVDLPEALDAPYLEPAGKAVWYSFGTLVANAAARVLQLDPGELKTGVRSARRGPSRIHGEVFLYDDVPGGAGYARAIRQNLEEVLTKALELGRRCDNPDCAGACYHCLYDYGNQAVHRYLDRPLGTAVLEFLLRGARPEVSPEQADRCATALTAYAQGAWQPQRGGVFDGRYLPLILENGHQRLGLWVIHPLQAAPSAQERQQLLARHGLRVAVHTSFDLERRPFWVMNNLVRP